MARLILASALGGPLAHAQLRLSGNVSGMFTDSSGGHTTVSNASDGSYDYFQSGVPQHSGDSPTMIEFWKQSFTDIGPGLVADNLFKITNGRNLLGTTADSAHFNLNLELTSPEASTHVLAIPFTINNTPNEPNDQNVNDNFSISAGAIAPFVIDNTRVQFSFSAPSDISIAEKSSMYVGSLWVRFTPVPEASTFAWGGAALLLGFIGFRMLSRRQREAAV
ncbi:MAG TPA: choice-of-anchor K domain-containing protein [Opitutus sp.]|nr:choice-of-anchor K domain-containing protein [Opitutus sp.]